jgi:nucleoside-diphosphate-sugar epimerase
MKVLLTGSTGFLGKHVKNALERKGIVAYTLGKTKDHHVVADLKEAIPPLPQVERVIHMAGLAHINPKNSDEKELFFRVNERGTIHLCHAIELMSPLPKQLIFISTVSVYGLETGHSVKEHHPLNGTSAYALSKIRAERFLLDWGKKHDVSILILRLPLIVGKGAPGNFGKMMDAIKRNRYLSVGGGKARKSMVLVEDICDLFVNLPLQSEGIYHLTDGYHPSFKELENVICQHLKTQNAFNIPLRLAYFFAFIGGIFPFIPINKGIIEKMTKDLTFDDKKAQEHLGWKPKAVLHHLFN